MKKSSKTGYVGVYKNGKSNTYYFSSQVHKNPYEKGRVIVSGFSNAQDASIARTKYEAENTHIREMLIKQNRLGYLLSKYFEWKEPLVKPTTYRHIVTDLDKYMIRPYGTYTIEEFCRSANLDNFRNKLLARQMTIGQKNKIFHRVVDVFEFGSLSNIVKFYYVNKVKIKMTKLKDDKKNKPNKDNYWTIAQWKKFLSVIDKNSEWYLLFTLFGQLGCRIGELRGLQNKHVDYKNGVIIIEQQALNNLGKGKTIIGSPKTLSSNRKVNISPTMLDMLKKYMDTNPPYKEDNFLFFNGPHPLGVSTIRRAFDFYIGKAELPKITLHGIRHSNCTWLLSTPNLTTQEIGQVSLRLGHASIKETLDIYMSIQKKENPVIVNELEDMLGDDDL